ncbi:uncharacterized protein EI90DRAFT_3114577 [Cantharellus anzutake]|uniref:uncharacterized protein n=1 Tax=Cantharellus anzutake TaxID=1750568 RepID=UPI0019030AC8|nr:uncharacterized protein EI90DRAFT_3114577 [Cantharellus anzutake]KAF8343927.1 hypothetical protein EI90DRAFT_3114577 [Cantharellus anzutake]
MAEYDFAEMAGRKRPHPQLFEEYSLLPSNDRNEWYFPKARTAVDLQASSDDGPLTTSQAEISRGNWGNKLKSDARWLKRLKIVRWGPQRSEWDSEERARKRLRQVMPESQSPSPEHKSLPHLRSQTPPLTASHVLSLSVHRDFTSFVLDPAIQHTFTSDNFDELSSTATELIAGEAGLRKAFGGLWRILEGDIYRNEIVHTDEDNGRSPGPEDDDNEESRRITHLPPLHRLFVTPSDIPLGPEPRTLLSPASQLESLEWAIGVLRELADDGKEYTSRLEEIRDGLGQSRAVRGAVWRECRIEAVDEMSGQVF